MVGRAKVARLLIAATGGVLLVVATSALGGGGASALERVTPSPTSTTIEPCPLITQPFPVVVQIGATGLTVHYSGADHPECGSPAGVAALTVRVAGADWNDGSAPAATVRGLGSSAGWGGDLTVTGLRPSTAYEWRLTSTGPGITQGQGAFTTRAAPVTSPPPTTSACAAANGPVSRVTATSITFSLPGSSCVPQAIFNVYLFTSEAAARANTPVAASGTGSRPEGSITVTGLSANTSYWYRFQGPAPAPVAGPVLTSAPVPASGCSATARVVSEWGAGTDWGGQIIAVDVHNKTSDPIRSWSVSWALAPQQGLGNGWGAAVQATAGTLTATGTDPLKAAQTLTFGLRLTGVGPVPAPTCRSTGVGRTVAVTESDSGRTVSLAVGDTLTVSLGADYDPLGAPSGTTGALVPVTATGGYPTGAALAASFRAAGPGEVDLRTPTDYDCFHTQPPCARPVRLWTVHVVVTP